MPKRKSAAPAKVGRPQLLTLELQEDFCREIRRAQTVAEACKAVGISESTFYLWQAKAEAEEGREFSEFLEAVQRAKQRRVGALEDLVLKAGRKDWRAAKAMLEVLASKQWAPRVRVHIEDELTGAVERLEEAFQEDPAGLERALTALAGGNRGGEAEQDSPEQGGADPRGSEALLATLPKPETGGLPSP